MFDDINASFQSDIQHSALCHMCSNEEVMGMGCLYN